MIITRYLVRETFKSQLAILFVLLLIFFCQKLVRIFGAAMDGEVSINLVLSLLCLGVPKMAELILPLSLFLGLLMTLSSMYAESEITVMYACGLGKSILIYAALVLSLITGICATLNVIWFSPWSSRHQDLMMAEAKANPNLSMAGLLGEQFKSAENGTSVLFLANFQDNAFEHVFLAQRKLHGHTRPSVLMASGGHIIQRSDGSQVVMLDKGTRYEGSATLHDFCITHFNKYQSVIWYKKVTVDSNEAEKMTILQLWASPTAEARAELHWRLTLVVSVLIMAMMVVPLSVVNPRQGRMLGMLPAMLLYLIFFLLQSTLRSNGAQGKLDPMLWMWMTNIAYLALALILNLWDSIPARRLRGRIHARGMP